jgi:hypothetical protein
VPRVGELELGRRDTGSFAGSPVGNTGKRVDARSREQPASRAGPGRALSTPAALTRYRDW